MSDISFITDNKGNKKSVVIDLKKYADFVEDLFDMLEIEKRKNEPVTSYEKLRSGILKKKSSGKKA
jgi:hypothetical protein